jgi:hypothetical protein
MDGKGEREDECVLWKNIVIDYQSFTTNRLFCPLENCHQPRRMG